MSLEIPVPSISEQNNICTILDKLAKSQQELAASYEVKIVSLEELKKSLLQKAFSGELTQSKGIAV